MKNTPQDSVVKWEKAGFSAQEVSEWKMHAFSLPQAKVLRTINLNVSVNLEICMFLKRVKLIGSLSNRPIPSAVKKVAKSIVEKNTLYPNEQLPFKLLKYILAMPLNNFDGFLPAIRAIIDAFPNLKSSQTFEQLENKLNLWRIHTENPAATPFFPGRGNVYKKRRGGSSYSN